MASARCATAARQSRARGLGRRRRGLGRCGAGSRRCAGDTATAFEIGRIPARALELETRCAELFAELGRTAGRAIGQGGVGDFLQNILGMSAGLTLVGVNGHEEGSFQVENSKPSIIGGGHLFKPPGPLSGRIQTGLTPRPPICGAPRAGCGSPVGPTSRSACPTGWPEPRPTGLETPRPQG